MKNFGKLFFLSFILQPFISKGQADAYTDPGLAYNKLLLEKNSNTYYRIGTFKVIGSPYLFGEDESGDIYLSSNILEDVKIRYNTYSQELEAFIKTGNNPLVQDNDNVDSFVFKPNGNHNEALVFVNKKLLNSTLKGYFLKINSGSKFSLFKAYRSSLGIVPTNYVQADLRQFELEYDYFYFNSASKQIKLLKPSDSFIKKEFKENLNVKIFFNEFHSLASEEMLKQLFIKLNQ